MDEKKYDTVPYETYKKFPRLISGLKEKCLVSLIKPEDFLKLRFVSSQRE